MQLRYGPHVLEVVSLVPLVPPIVCQQVPSGYATTTTIQVEIQLPKKGEGR